MSNSLPLYYKALLAWRRELERRRRAALEDKETPLYDGLTQKLARMFGHEHIVEVEIRDDDPYDLVLRATVDNLRFIGFRSPDGSINIVLLMKCHHCGHEMPSDPLRGLADLGRALLQLDMSGTLSTHQC